MNSSPPKPVQPLRVDPNLLPPPKWWGKFILEGTPPQRRFVVRWGRLLSVLGSLCLTLYLALATALWGYYTVDRQISGIKWIDIVVLPRFSRVQAAIGDSYFSDAKVAWAKRDYVHAIFTARAAVQKSPSNLDARLFLADCWRKVGRNAEAIRTLRDGIEYNAADIRLQQKAVETCLETGRYRDELKLLREDFPSRGVHLLDHHDWTYDLAEVKAVLETSGAAQAATVAAGHPELSTLPQAAPLLATVDAELGHQTEALERLRVALVSAPADSAILGAYANTEKSLGRIDDAKEAARRFLAAYPSQVDAQLCFLEMYGSRAGDDQTRWTAECMTFLKQHRHEPDAMERFGSLAASEGWADIAFLLYENSLQENLTGMPFAIYYAASLLKAGDVAAADSVWHQLALRNDVQLASASYVEAMVAWGSGRESEAMQIIERLRAETADNPSRRRSLESLFRTFGYPKIADALAANPA